MIVKGLRVISDFEYEFQMNQLNRTLAPDIETVYVMASPQVSFVSSSGVKEIASFGGNVEELVPAAVARRLRELFPNGRGGTPRQRPGVDFRPMDVLVLIDKLDDLVHNAKAVPLTDQVRIDREEIYDILDQMRATIPEEIKQARWIVKERQEMLAEAKREQDRLLQEAREQAVREASQTEIVKLAERQAQEIIDEARRQAREMRLEMEDWADGMLATLEINLDKFLTAVRRGRERLHERSQETVVAGIGPIDVDDDGSSSTEPRRRAGPRRTLAGMTSFSLRQVRLRPGEEHREALEVELPAFEFGGQRYIPVRSRCRRELVVTRRDDRHGVRARVHRAAARALLPLPRRRRARGADPRPRVPGRRRPTTRS